MYNDPISCGAEKKQNFKQMSKKKQKTNKTVLTAQISRLTRKSPDKTFS